MARILIVDDESVIRSTLRQMLENAGHEIYEASNGDEALRSFGQFELDLVITDIIMPKKEGIETIRELRAKAPDVKIIAISGGDRRGRSDYLGMAIKLGANEVISKPFRREQILKAVQDTLG